MILPSVFVQIPTNNTNLVPTKTNAGPTVRRYDEIKAEPPIKSEIDNANQSIAVRSSKDAPQTSSDSNGVNQQLTANLVTARPKVKCFKCEQCPFMSISQDGYNNHMQTVHNDQMTGSSTTSRNKILCPGCENVFYSKMSLKIHLVNDHQMSRSDISQLLESLFAKKSSAAEKSTEKRVQKIYLKNVEVLLDSEAGGEFGGQETPPTIASPIESQTECLSNSTDNDNSIEANYNRNAYDQMDGNYLCQQITNVEFNSSSQIAPLNSRESITFRNISPMIEITSIDDPNGRRPDSGSSIKYSENFVGMSNVWPSISTASFSACQTPSPPVTSRCQNEKKKIYIKNIDILKEPLIKPTQMASMADPSYRKNTLHLRTVDEVNLLINRQHENSNFNSSDTITLNEEDYRYVLNDATEYNNIISPYLDNEVNDFDLLSNEPIAVANMNEYFSATANLNYSLPNLESAGPTLIDGNNVICPDSSNETDVTQSLQTNHDRTMITLQTTAFDAARMTDGYSMNGSIFEHNDANRYFTNKYLPTKIIDNTESIDDDQCMMLTDQCVSSEAIIDILDLTNDEVEQILDNDLMDQDFDALPYTNSNSNSSSLNGKCMGKIHPIDGIWLDSVSKINVATNLMMEKPDGKSIDMRSLETPTIDLDGQTLDIDSESTDKPIDQPSTVLVVKKKSGRTKGSKRKSDIENRDVVTRKCSITNCGMRFATEPALELHEQCHLENGNGIFCPKCESDETGEPSKPRNWNWNTLHTHLWREHSIDMELYSCPHCSFKTPILSRLKNTHMRIHSDEKDFKCDYCSKAFKNARQMKNHRRIHTRNSSPTISQCKYCGQSFLSAKHLKEHYYTHSEAIEHQRQPFALQCDICSATFASKHALRVHHLKHFGGKRFSCEFCDYKSNDHNAFRRHQMVHSKQMKYKCPCCAFKCIQSTNYKNHVLKKHPDAAKELMFMCDKCNFVTVNKRMYDMHCLNQNHSRMPSVQLE